MRLDTLFIADDIGCDFHDGVNIVLGVNRVDKSAPSSAKAQAGEEDGHTEESSPHAKDTDSGLSVPGSQGKQPSDSLISDTNGVGKTLLLSIIKHVLGGDTERAFSSPFFAQHRHWASLQLSWGNSKFVVARALWHPLADNLYLVCKGDMQTFHERLEAAKVDLQDIDSPRDLAEQLASVDSAIRAYTKKEFQAFIAKRERIDYSQSNITFSSLLDFMIRDEKVGFNDPIGRIRRSQWVQYRSMQYLFGLPATTEEQCSGLQERIAALRLESRAAKDHLAVKKITGDDKIENLKLQAAAKLKETQESIDAVRVLPSLETVRAEYEATKRRFAKLAADISKKERYLRGYVANRDHLKRKSKAMADLLKVTDFYEDLLQFFPEQLEANISNFRSFFDNLSNDREQYYSDLLSEIRADIKLLSNEKSSLEPKLATLAKQFRSTSLIKDIATLASTEEKIQTEIKELDECRKLLIRLEALEDECSELEQRRRDILAAGRKQAKDAQETRRELINLFHELIKEIYGTDDGELAFEFNSSEASSTAGRTEIFCRVPSQTSHGRTYAKINIFDFVWLLGPKHPDVFDPGFLAHDGSYSKISREVKTHMLRAISSRLKGKQYIVTINEGELADLDAWKERVCIRLDGSQEEGKLFHQQFD